MRTRDWMDISTRVSQSNRRVYPPVDALPKLATSPYRATQHDAWDCPQLGAPLIASHTGEQMGDPEPCRNKRCWP